MQLSSLASDCAICSMSNSTDSASAPRGKEPRRRFSVRRLVWGLFLLMLAVLFVPRAPSEVAFWYLAAAEIAAEEQDLDRSLRLIDRALAWAPQEPRVHHSLVTAMRIAGRPNEAMDSIDRVLASEPDRRTTFDLYLLRSNINSVEGRHEEALRDYDAAAKINSALRPSWQRVQLLIAARRIDEARAELKLVEANEGGIASGWGLLGDVNEHNNKAYFMALLEVDLDVALQHAEKAVTGTRAKVASFLDTRGFVHYKRGEYEEALADFSKAVQMADEPPRPVDKMAAGLASHNERHVLAVLRYHKGLALAALERTEEAEREFARVRELGFEPTDELF
jgi:tetratricopeptide (TPR) repeat protein